MSNDFRILLIPEGASKDRRSRLGNFADWLTETGGQWDKPDLLAYRDYFLVDHCSNSTAAYLSTVRGRYRELSDNLLMAADPECSRVKQEIKQDWSDSEYGTRLTREQARALLAAPGNTDLLGIRNTAMLAVMLYTGIREQELCNLKIRDLRQSLDGNLALHVREGKNLKTRLVPYGTNAQCLSLVDTWIEAARITKSFVFRPMWKSHSLRPGPLSCRTVQKTMKRYPIMIDGELRTVTPHDLRRTFARRCYDEGMTVISIQKNLGHTSLDGALLYIGLSETEDRKPPELYEKQEGTSE